MKGYEKIKLHGFNNLTKTLSFNIYDICFTRTREDRKKYIEYIDEQYNSDRLTNILKNVTDTIGAHVLNIAKQDYDPQGASVTILISEEEVPAEGLDDSCNKGTLVNKPQSVVGHLDKSHLTVHTYPEYHPDNGISTFRVDIDVSTCGKISPLKALDYLIDCFDSDIITIDYRVRGFTRDDTGHKLFIDHNINSIQNYIQQETLNKYQMIDVNVYQENIFHTKMMLKDFELNNYLLELTKDDLTKKEQSDINKRLRKEMKEIYYGRNIVDCE